MKRKLKKEQISSIFTKRLLAWHLDIDRDMPWKKTRDPYKIWISEIVLQQTRVAQGTAYYNRLIEAFPTVEDLAQASEDNVLSLWKGLGYYARARNLHYAAKQIVNEYNGVFPRTYEAIISLKGVGVYTAAAIASFAFNLPYAVVDGNVYRVLSRFYNNETPIDTTAGKKMYAALAQANMDISRASEYNQAIMDFGALQCTPVSPPCEVCIMKDDCAAYHEGTVDLLPIKEKKLEIRSRYFNYLYIQKKGQIIMKKRVHRDIWQGLYELPMIESSRRLRKKEITEAIHEHYGLKDVKAMQIKRIWYHEQRLSHRLIHGTFYEIISNVKIENGQWIAIEDSHAIGVPKIIDLFLERMASQ